MTSKVIENAADDVALSIDITEDIINEQTPYQHIHIADSKSYGKILLLDHLFMCSEKDGYIGSEMITHISMNTGFSKKQVLVVGGGDGRTVGELLKYKDLKSIDVIDIDERVVECMKEHFPKVKENLENPKVHLHITDGLEYMRKNKGKYDVIFMTSTDPVGVSLPLFTDEFYELCRESLTENGIFLTDAYMPFYADGPINYATMYNKVKEHFKTTKLYTATVPIFPGGLFSWVVGSKMYDPENDILDFDPPKCKYYNKKLHKACFTLPQFMLDKIKS